MGIDGKITLSFFCFLKYSSISNRRARLLEQVSLILNDCSFTELTYEEKLKVDNERYAALNIQHAAQHMKVKEREVEKAKNEVEKQKQVEKEVEKQHAC